jgi:hypothetical protein
VSSCSRPKPNPIPSGIKRLPSENKPDGSEPRASPPEPRALPWAGLYRAFSPFRCQDEVDGFMPCPFRLVLFLSVGKIRKFFRAESPVYPSPGQRPGFPVATPWVSGGDALGSLPSGLFSDGSRFIPDGIGFGFGREQDDTIPHRLLTKNPSLLHIGYKQVNDIKLRCEGWELHPSHLPRPRPTREGSKDTPFPSLVERGRGERYVSTIRVRLPDINPDSCFRQNRQLIS